MMEERRIRFLDIIFILVLVPLAIYGLYDFLQPAEERPIINNEYTYNINGQDNLTVVAENSLPGTVTILASGDDFYSYNLGSGFLAHEEGYIATNYHVVEDIINSPSYDIYISHYKMDENDFHEAEILWTNPSLDLAILVCDCNGEDHLGDDYPVLPMNDRTIFTTDENRLRILENIIAIGSPLSLDYKNTVTTGEVSGFNRVSQTSTNFYEHLIQITVPINPGNSGGPLIDRNGNVIALNTLGFGLIYDSNGDLMQTNAMFFAVPIAPVKLVIERVVAAHKQGGYLKTPTIGFSPLDKNMTTSFTQNGILIAEITSGGASQGKLAVNDIITGIKVGGVEYDIKIRNDLIYALLRANVGDVVEVVYKRGIFTDLKVEITLK